jgi:hypothetical protein
VDAAGQRRAEEHRRQPTFDDRDGEHGSSALPARLRHPPETKSKTSGANEASQKLADRTDS